MEWSRCGGGWRGRYIVELAVIERYGGIWLSGYGREVRWDLVERGMRGSNDGMGCQTATSLYTHCEITKPGEVNAKG